MDKAKKTATTQRANITNHFINFYWDCTLSPISLSFPLLVITCICFSWKLGLLVFGIRFYSAVIGILSGYEKN